MTKDEFCGACRSILASGTKPIELEVCSLLQPYYNMPGNEAGGSLHLVLDDGNNDEESVRFCLKWAISRGDECGELFARVLLLCSERQRANLRVPL